MNLEIETVDAVIGARVHGIDLGKVPDAATITEIETALEHHGVLIFPDQNITPAEQVAFSRALGPLERTELARARHGNEPDIFMVGNTMETPVTFAPPEEGGELEWHTDHIHRPVPARASLLHAIEVPSTGGDTLFACMYRAYETLTPKQQSEYDRLEVINDVAGLLAYLSGQGYDGIQAERDERENIQVIWPLVRAHPLTGRKALYFGNQVSIGIKGWPQRKGYDFIKSLTGHACQPAFQYRHKWAKGDAVLWDNRRVLHAGTPYDLTNETRLMHRTTLRETEPIMLVSQ